MWRGGKHDPRAYVILADGTYNRLGDGLVWMAQPGGFVETSCDAGLVCQIIVYGVEATVSLPMPSRDAQGNFSNIGFSISPGGRSAIFTTDGKANFLRFADGSQSPITADGTSAYVAEGNFRYGFFFGNGPSSVSWVGPEDRYAVFASFGDLVVYDTSDGTARRIDLPSDFDRASVLGVG